MPRFLQSSVTHLMMMDDQEANEFRASDFFYPRGFDGYVEECEIEGLEYLGWDDFHGTGVNFRVKAGYDLEHIKSRLVKAMTRFNQKFAPKVEEPDIEEVQGNHFVMIVTGDIEPEIFGPFNDTAAQIKYANKHREQDPEMEDGIYWIDVLPSGELRTGTFNLPAGEKR